MQPRQQEQLVLARGHMEAGRLDKAQAILLRLARDGAAPVYVHDLLTVIASQQGNAERALHHRTLSFHAAPHDAAILGDLVSRLVDLRRFDQAHRVLNEFLTRAPDNPEAQYALADFLVDRNRLGDAQGVIERLLAAHPDHSGGLRLHALVLARTGRDAEALAACRRARQTAPDDLLLGETLAYALNYAAGIPEPEVFGAHCHFGRLMEARFPGPAFAHPRTDDPERPLRIGLVSHDFNVHSVAFLVEPILDHLPRDRFEVHCYYTRTLADEATDRMRAKARTFNVALNPSHDALAAKIHHDRIDILVDLCGLTRGHSLPAFSRRPAPVQVTALGYPNTTGMRAIDYRLVDALTDPPGAERWAIEKLERPNRCFLCYRPPEFLLAIPPRMTQEGAPVRFGCFNSAMKVTDPLLRAWADLLTRVPGSRLTIKASGLEEPQMLRAFQQRAQAAGIANDRTDIMGMMPDRTAHLDLYGTIDVALDTFPYHGTVTTLEALAMGVPVVSAAGQVHRSRVGLSLLTALGRPHWCAQSLERYVQVAAELAADRDQRRVLRHSLRQELLASALCDGPAYGRGLAESLRRMWRARCGAT